MSKTATVRVSIEPGLKEEAERVFHGLGLSPTQAIALFYRQVKLRNCLPFDVAIPNETTRKTFEDTDAGRDLVVCEDTKGMFEKLGI